MRGGTTPLSIIAVEALTIPVVAGAELARRAEIRNGLTRNPAARRRSTTWHNSRCFLTAPGRSFIIPDPLTWDRGASATCGVLVFGMKLAAHGARSFFQAFCGDCALPPVNAS